MRASGADSASLRGRCILHTGSGKTTVLIIDGLPLERRLEAVGIACDLEALGQVTVEVQRGSSRSRTSSSGGRMLITFGSTQP